ncbi:putative kinesin [Leishmania major strain Friedlin]|uniref:Putative kinesin n=1 Tax=Leishmania major TaxID=5664 RepID=Q4QJD9_LEIMA|nr:putative kinesin [Leishmania major strain Friedlin]CAG9568243.1 kinesin_-_putative [Leishmania major strain Friedlin]CAJ01983.1 putative kinesin [Leishmania major strain Friedlin]|eukprot:XP_001687540.1 putative kinesin [Leishmania major strain Friedlin]
MPKVRGEESIGVYLRIRPPPTSQQSRLLATGGGGGTAAVSSPFEAARGTGQSPATFQYEVEEDFQRSILHLHTAQRLVQEAQRASTGPSPSQPSSVPANNPRGGGGSTSHAAGVDDVVNNTVVDFQYSFDRVFKPSATQEDVFATVAKGCVASVLDGMNSTVFAYGQTGSGKTYSITGGTESYQDRGLIPRAMAMIYEEVARRREGGGGRHPRCRRSSSVGAAGDDGDHASDGDASGGGATTYTITMSYLQIYNDKGQDLLNHGRDARTLEELPAVTIHEMEDDIMLKGLEQHSAPTLADALNLLFLGDTNRLYCETPMNKTSSRSHCIFTIYLEARSASSSVVRRSKLNLVDLAGSERVSKTGVSGTILTEAKHINLSLHFLEQVIVALSEKAKGVRDHVPYRNSFLTMALRDSLGRNCKTVMLATAHVVASQVAETMSTCQFAQRVALIQQAPQVNVETDPVLLVRKLRAEVAQLKDEVAYLRANGGGSSAASLAADRTLTADEKNVCRGMVDAYIQKAAVDGDWSSRLTGLNGDMARIYCCYEILRERLVRGGGGAPDDTQQQRQQKQRLDDSEAQVTALRHTLQLKENELQMLLTVLKKAGHADATSGVGGAGGGAGLGAAGVRYTAVAQTPHSNGGAISGSGEAEGVVGVPFVFTRSRSSSGSRGANVGDVQNDEHQQAELLLRQNIYRDAQQLIAQLRRLAGAALTHATAAAAPPHAERTVEAALTRVTTLAQQGQFTEAEAAAATEFLESKREYRQHVANLHKRSEGDKNNGGGGGGGAGGGDARTAVDVLMDEQFLQNRAQALEAFKASYDAQHKVEETKLLLRPKYAACKASAQQLNACVDAIKQLKTKIQRRRAERAAEGSDVADAEEVAWLAELSSTKERYNVHAAQLRHDKEEIDGMHAYLKHAQEQLVRDFERWFSARQQQVQLAVQQQELHAQRRHEEEKRTELTDGLRAALGISPTNVPLSEKPGPNMCATPPPSPRGDTGYTASSITSSQCGSSLPFSPLFSAAQPQRSYAHSASQSMIAVPCLPNTSGSGGLSAVLLPSTTQAPVRGEHHSSSVPTLSLTAPSARLAMTVKDGQPHSADVALARLSPSPTVQRDGASASPPATSPGLTGPARNAWTTAKASTTLMMSGGTETTPSPTRPFHLLPLGNTTTTTTAANSTALSVAPAGSAASADKKRSNPYFPLFPSTGNAAADAQLAELYKAREAMRKQFQ